MKIMSEERELMQAVLQVDMKIQLKRGGTLLVLHNRQYGLYLKLTQFFLQLCKTVWVMLKGGLMGRRNMKIDMVLRDLTAGRSAEDGSFVNGCLVVGMYG